MDGATHDCASKAAFLIFALAILPLSASADETYSPYVERAYPSNVYWGDTHVHTSFSSHDANIGGKNRASPEIAYRFARGEEVVSSTGRPVKLARPW